jgi:hypothetical protein
MNGGDMWTIRPWVGRSYAEGVLGKRVFLLGESNYHKTDKRDDDYSNIVCENIEACAINGRARFFTKAAKVVLMAAGIRQVSREQVVDLWHRVAFTNYVQKVFESDRVRPSPEDWQFARAALSGALAAHRPEVIVAFGLELASHLTWLRDVAPDVKVVGLAHPSSVGFKYDRWVPVVAGAFAGSP